MTIEKIVWQSQITEEMVKNLNPNEISLLCDSLSDAVQEICESYEVA
jgi:hypothetical protein